MVEIFNCFIMIVFFNQLEWLTNISKKQKLRLQHKQHQQQKRINICFVKILYLIYLTNLKSYLYLFRPYSTQELNKSNQFYFIIIKQLLLNNSMNKNTRKKYFKIIQNSTFPSIASSQNQQNKIQIETANILKHHQYIYLDLNSTRGFKVMENVQSDYSDDDNQKLGLNIICDTLKVSKQKVKLRQFMTINVLNRQKRIKIRQKIKLELQKSKQKISKSLKTLDQRPKMYLGMDNKKFNMIKSNIQIEGINENILKKQQQIVQKLGIIADFQSIYQKNTESIQKKLKKKEAYFLPKILKSYH